MARFFVVILVVLTVVASFPVYALEGCKACFIGGDNKAWCRDPDIVKPTFTLYANCRGVTYCYYDPYSGLYCWPQCTGFLCALA